jgi:hypothetical protein
MLKTFLATLMLTIVGGLAVMVVAELFDWAPSTAAQIVRPMLAPKTDHLSHYLSPGQVWTIRNPQFQKVHVQARFPVRVVIGSCFNTSTFDYECDTKPADIFIQDNRNRPLFSTPQANDVEVSVTEF